MALPLPVQTKNLADSIFDGFLDPTFQPARGFFPLRGLAVDPFCAYIERCGIQTWRDSAGNKHTHLGVENLHRFTGESYDFVDYSNSVPPHEDRPLLTQDYINETRVTQETRRLATEIRQYYVDAFVMMKLGGEELTPWRQELMRVFRNADLGVVENEADFKIMHSIVKFYHEDLLIDDLLSQCKTATGYTNANSFPSAIEQTVRPITLMRDETKHGKHQSNIFMYCKNEQQHLIRIRLTGNNNTFKLLHMLTETGAQFKVMSNSCVTIRKSLGTGLEYVECNDADFNLL